MQFDHLASDDDPATFPISFGDEVLVQKLTQRSTLSRDSRWSRRKESPACSDVPQRQVHGNVGGIDLQSYKKGQWHPHVPLRKPASPYSDWQKLLVPGSRRGDAFRPRLASLSD